MAVTSNVPDAFIGEPRDGLSAGHALPHRSPSLVPPPGRRGHRSHTAIRSDPCSATSAPSERRIAQRRRPDDRARGADSRGPLRPRLRRAGRRPPRRWTRSPTAETIARDDLAVRRCSRSRPVQVDDVEPSRTGIGKSRRNLDRIVAVGGFAIEIALLQTDDPPTSQVDRGQDLEAACVAHIIMLPY